MRYTKQRAFDIVAHHLAMQGGPAMIGTTCAYRTQDRTRKCALGALIPDRLYEEWMDKGALTGNNGARVADVIRAANIVVTDYISNDNEFIVALQRAHDNANFSTDAREWGNPYGAGGIADRLLSTADEYGLDPQAVRDFFPE